MLAAPPQVSGDSRSTTMPLIDGRPGPTCTIHSRGALQCRRQHPKVGDGVPVLLGTDARFAAWQPCCLRRARLRPNYCTQTMNPLELARLVELSEASAYASLMACRAPTLGPGDFEVARVGSAWALMSPRVIGSLTFNRVIGLGLEESAAEAQIEEVAHLYGSRRLSFAIEMGPHARPVELPGWLRARRIRRSLPTAMYYREARPMTVRGGSAVAVRAGTAVECEQVAEICSKVFRMPDCVRQLLAATRGDPRWRQWLVHVGAQPIAAALSFVDQGVAWLGWDATLPQCRGNGAQGALIAARLNDAHACGCQFVTTETAVHTAVQADPSARNYEKREFLLAQNRVTYVAIRPPSGAFAPQE